MYGHLNNSLLNEFEPSEFYLSQNYPNPFKERTVIKYCVAVRVRVILTVYDAENKKIEKLVDEYQNPGTYEVEFSAGHSCESRNLPAGRQGPEEGTYFYRFEAGDYNNEKKMILTK
jgi:5-hydroxyisourate hydrolase-like protein (transthyretin family)